MSTGDLVFRIAGDIVNYTQLQPLQDLLSQTFLYPLNDLLFHTHHPFWTGPEDLQKLYLDTEVWSIKDNNSDLSDNVPSTHYCPLKSNIKFTGKLLDELLKQIAMQIK